MCLLTPLSAELYRLRWNMSVSDRASTKNTTTSATQRSESQTLEKIKFLAIDSRKYLKTDVPGKQDHLYYGMMTSRSASKAAVTSRGSSKLKLKRWERGGVVSDDEWAAISRVTHSNRFRTDASKNTASRQRTLKTRQTCEARERGDDTERVGCVLSIATKPIEKSQKNDAGKIRLRVSFADKVNEKVKNIRENI